MYNEDKKRKEKKNIIKKANSNYFSKFFRKRTKRLLTNIDRLFSKIMWMEIGISAITILLGIIFLLNPEISVTVIGIIFGVTILLAGILNIYAYLKRKELTLFRYHLIYGLVGLLLGVLTILNPFTFTQMVTIFIGLWILYTAIMKIDFALRLKKIPEKSWTLFLVTAILEIVMSILIMINPFSNLVITQLAGAYFVLCGILNSMNAILTKNRAIDFLEKL